VQGASQKLQPAGIPASLIQNYCDWGKIVSEAYDYNKYWLILLALVALLVIIAGVSGLLIALH
jgi:ABC-type dipeptide/oligopeptide/nickel transport system permease subunit